VTVCLAAPAAALDDKDFCVVAQQLALAAEKDVGVWVDRLTRHAGMFVTCEKRMVEFSRFTYATSASMTDAWKQGKATDWSAVQCSSPVWNEAIRGGWKVVLRLTAADGGHVAIEAQCAPRRSSSAR
jgi:hypothetical protein